MTRAARFGVLKKSMKGMNSGYREDGHEHELERSDRFTAWHFEARRCSSRRTARLWAAAISCRRR